MKVNSVYVKQVLLVAGWSSS